MTVLQIALGYHRLMQEGKGDAQNIEIRVPFASDCGFVYISILIQISDTFWCEFPDYAHVLCIGWPCSGPEEHGLGPFHMTLPGGVLWEHTWCTPAVSEQAPDTCAAAGSSAPVPPVLHPTTSASTFPEGHWDPNGSFHALENLTPNQVINEPAQISPPPKKPFVKQTQNISIIFVSNIRMA